MFLNQFIFLFLLLFTAVSRAGLYDEVTSGPCAMDFERLCRDVEPGGGRILICLEKNASLLSYGCRSWGGFGRSLMYGSDLEQPVEAGKKRVGRFVVEEKPQRPSCTRAYIMMHGGVDCIE